MTEGKVIPFYRNAADTLASVGITKRQLNYWRKAGLFHPELEGGDKFTSDDTMQLYLLKALIVELGLPISTVQKLMPTGRTFRVFRNNTYIDIHNIRLVTPGYAMGELMAQTVYEADQDQLLNWFKAIAAELLFKYRASSSPSVYVTRKQELEGTLRKADQFLRIHRDEGGYVLQPAYPGDPELTQDELQELDHELEFDSLLLRLQELHGKPVF